jgi:competence protein ComEC
MRRVLIIVFSCFLFGVLIYHKLNVLLIGAVITALFLIIYIKKYRVLCIFCIIFLVIGFSTAYIHERTFENRYESISKSSTFEGYVIDKDAESYTIKNYNKNYKIIFYLYKKSALKPGDYVKFNGKAKEKPDFKKANLNSRMIDAYVTCFDATMQITNKRSLLLLPAIIKYKINSAILSISRTGGGFICGLVSGYTGDINIEDISDFKELGLSHILAVSGFNLGIIYYFLSIATRKMSAKLRYIVILGICFTYTAFAGFDPSISRAFIMVFISIYARIIKRPYDVLNGITFTAFIMLILNSYNVFNIGFILSFAATYGIVLLKDDINDRLPSCISKFRNELSVSIAAFIATLPIILWYMGVFSIFSVIINILISPIISFLTILSFIASIIYIFTGFKILFYPSVFIGEIVIKFIRLSSKININIYPGKPSEIFIIMYYVFILFHFGYIKIKVNEKKIRFIKFATIFIIIITLVYHKPLLKIHVLNVGQGDSILIETPSRKNILIDTGPELYSYVSTRDKIIPYLKRLGYNKIDMIIITHPHMDHAGGLKYLIDNFNINKILVYEKLDFIDYNWIYLIKGDSIRIDDVIINILSPEKEIKLSSDENETCLIMELNYKDFSMLFTGDAPKSDLDFISGQYDILKVPHHGSILSLSEEMLNNTSIGNAIISVGKNNFGHPSPVVIREFEKHSIGVFRTDKLGDIIIQTQGNQYSILSQ